VEPITVYGCNEPVRCEASDELLWERLYAGECWWHRVVDGEAIEMERVHGDKRVED